MNSKELKIGTKIEMEHTTSSKKAAKIAKDHLKEFPNYYTKGLIPMERRLKKMNTPKILKAGLTLGIGYTTMGFIPFNGNFHVIPGGSIVEGRTHAN